MGAQHPGGLLHRFQAAAHRAEARKSAQLFCDRDRRRSFNAESVSPPAPPEWN